MLGMAATGVGAIAGLVIGVGLSVYVAILDMRKREAGIRTRAQYRGSLVLAPLLLAGLGGLIAGGIARLF
jgi:ABC-type antimicrobial peptide transport system permease subunit